MNFGDLDRVYLPLEVSAKQEISLASYSIRGL